MSERAFALDAFPRPGRPERAGVSVAERRLETIAQIAAWPETLAAVRGALQGVIGAEPPAIGRIARSGGALIAALAPGRFLVLHEEADLVSDLEAAVPASSGAVTDLGHARTILRLSGDAVVPLLSKGVLLDLDPRAFPPGALAQTSLHHMDVLLLRYDERTFDLAVFRGFAVSLAEWLADAGLEFGIAFEG